MHVKHMILPMILLTACGGGGESSSSNSPTTRTETPPIVQTASKMAPMERGARLYKRCSTCHTLDEGAVTLRSLSTFRPASVCVTPA